MPHITKFRTDPSLFFSESRWLCIRAIGRVLEKVVFNKPGFRLFLIDPAEALSNNNNSLLSTLGSKITHYQHARRKRLFDVSKSPLISIIMAVYNSERTLANAIDSIKSQTYSRWELFIVDDGSTDRSLQICKDYSALDSRIKVLRNSTNRGAALARNKGLEATEGAYITFQDSDDLSHPERLERQLYELLKSSDSILCTCRYVRVNDALEPVSVNGKTSRKCIIAMMFHADSVKHTNGYFMNLPIGEDSEYFERIKAVHGKNTEAHLAKVLYLAKIRMNSTMFSDTVVESSGSNYINYLVSNYSINLVNEMNEFHESIVSGEKSPFIPSGNDS